MNHVNLGAFFTGLLPTLLAIIIPIITAYITKALVNITKKVDAFAASRPYVKQLWSFVVAAALSLLLALFGTTDLGIILNTIIAGGLAMILHNGNKVATLNVSLSGTSMPAHVETQTVVTPVTAVTPIK